MSGKHSWPTPQGRYFWWSERLWALAKDLPVKRVLIDSIAEFDQNCWFSLGSSPTCRDVAKHAKRILDADLAYPIVLAADGHLMDGGHRIAKAWISGEREVNAVQFEVDPKPDWVEDRAEP
jgi:hypothetical protein